MSVTLYWILVIVALGAEMLFGTVYLLCVAIGLVGAAITLHITEDQILALSVLGVITFISGIAVLLYRKKQAQEHDPMQDLDVGHHVRITRVQADGSAVVMYRGARWVAKPQAQEVLAVGRAKIIATRGAQLIVSMEK